jgi:putative transposase
VEQKRLGQTGEMMPNSLYATDLTNPAWELIAPFLPAALPGGPPRTTNVRAVLNAIFYLLRTGWQWRLLPREFPVWGTVYHYFRSWKNVGVWIRAATLLRVADRFSLFPSNVWASAIV